MKKINIALFISFIFLTFWFSNFKVFSERYLSYYQAVLEKNGIKTTILDTDMLLGISTEPFSTSSVGQDFIIDSLNFSYLNNYLSTSYTGKIFVVCTSKLILNENVSCDNNGIYLGFDSFSQSVFFSSIDNVSYYLIPEVYFSHPSRYDELKESLRILVSSSVETSSIDNLKLPYLFRYIFLLFVLIFSLYLFFTKYTSFKSGLQIIFIHLIKWISSFRSFNFYILFVSFLIYPFILSVISFLDTGELSFQYMYAFFLDTTSISNFFMFIQQGIFLKALIFLVNYFIFLILVITLFPLLLEHLEFILISFLPYSIKQIKYSYIWYTLSFILMVVLLVTNSIKNYPFLFVMSCLFFFYFHFFDSTIYLLNKKEKLFLTSALSIFVLIILLLNFYYSEEKTSLLKIFPNINTTVFLPAKVSTDGVSLYSNLLVESTYPLIADIYPVYFPGYSSIILSNVLDFSFGNKNFIILADNISDYAKFLVVKPDLVTYVKSSTFDSLVLLKYQDLYTDNLYMHAKFDCSKELSAVSLNAKFYEIGEDVRTVKILNLPGCKEGFLEYDFPLIFTPKNLGYVLLQLENIDPNIMSNIFIANRDFVKNNNYVFVKNPESNKVLYNSITFDSNNDGDLHAFIFRDIESFKLDSFTKNSSFDLSTSLNKLIINQYLTKDFYIWSTDTSAIIKIVKNWFYL